MSSIADPTPSASIEPQPARTLDGGRMVLRGLQGIVGAALVCAALGLLLAAGAYWTQDIMLIKLGISVVTAMVGLAFLQEFVRPPPPKVEIDTIEHEVRLVRTRGKDRHVLERCAFRDLTLVRDSGTHVQLWGKNFAFIAEVAATDRVSHQNLVTALRVAGKL